MTQFCTQLKPNPHLTSRFFTLSPSTPQLTNRSFRQMKEAALSRYDILSSQLQLGLLASGYPVLPISRDFSLTGAHQLAYHMNT